jgi:hypothetical protein
MAHRNPSHENQSGGNRTHPHNENRNYQNQHESEGYRSRGEERPRDEYGRFESEPEGSRREWRGDWGDRSAYERFGYDRSGYDRGDYGNGEYERDYGRSGPGRYELRGRQYDDWRDQSSYARGQSDYDRSQGSRYPEPRGYGSESYYHGGTSPGGNYRFESVYSEPLRGDQGRWERWSGDRNTPYIRGWEEPRGQFSGRGPKGYRRSDERIEEDVNEALYHDAELDASELEVKVSNGEVTLSGTVNDRQSKRRAEDIAERCSGVQDVRNEIRVQRESGSQTQGQEQSKGKTASGAGTRHAEAKSA